MAAKIHDKILALNFHRDCLVRMDDAALIVTCFVTLLGHLYEIGRLHCPSDEQTQTVQLLGALS